MTDLIIPNPRFEMPELFYPGRKPVGSVKIDWDHPLSREMKECHLLTQPNDLDLVDHVIREQDYRTALTEVSKGGLVFTSLGGAIEAENDQAIRLKQVGPVPSGYVTVIFEHNPAGQQGDMYLYTHGDHLADHRIYLGVNLSAEIIVRLGAGVTEAIASVQNGINIATMTWSGTTADVCLNGVFYTYTFTGVPGSYGDATIETLLGGYNNPSTSEGQQRSFGGTIYGCYQGGRRLIKEEMSSIDTHPYQFLIPAG